MGHIDGSVKAQLTILAVKQSNETMSQNDQYMAEQLKRVETSQVEGVEEIKDRAKNNLKLLDQLRESKLIIPQDQGTYLSKIVDLGIVKPQERTSSLLVPPQRSAFASLRFGKLH